MKHKKIPKDIQLMVSKGNFVIAIKSLSEREGISLDEAKQKIDAFEADFNAQDSKSSKTFAKNDQEGFNHLVGSVDENIASQGIPQWMTSKWFRVTQIVILIILLLVLLWLFG